MKPHVTKITIEPDNSYDKPAWAITVHYETDEHTAKLLIIRTSLERAIASIEYAVFCAIGVLWDGAKR